MNKSSRREEIKIGFFGAILALFLVGCGYLAVGTQDATPTPMKLSDGPATDHPRVGDIAPDFTLPDSDENMVHLADEVQDHKVVVLVFFNARY